VSAERPPRPQPCDEREHSPARLAPLVRVDERARIERTLIALSPKLRALLFRMLGPQPALDDALQDTLIELTRALPRFLGQSSVEAYARTIAVRVAYRYFKREPALAAFDPELCAAADQPADEELAQRRALIRLHRCMAKLSPKRRAAFALCAIEGLSPHEAAELVGSSPGAMRARYMHARDELQRLLGASEAAPATHAPNLTARKEGDRG
jgi:RNA polymerase sigma factor (sigma-70 family)